MLEQCATTGITIGRTRRSMQWDAMDTRDRDSPREKEREVHLEDHSASSAGARANSRITSRTKGREKEKREKANSKMFINPVQGKYRGGGIPAQVRGRGWGRVIFKELREGKRHLLSLANERIIVERSLSLRKNKYIWRSKLCLIF